MTKFVQFCYYILTGINRQGDLYGAAQSGFGDISSGHCEQGVPTEAALLGGLHLVKILEL